MIYMIIHIYYIMYHISLNSHISRRTCLEIEKLSRSTFGCGCVFIKLGRKLKSHLDGSHISYLISYISYLISHILYLISYFLSSIAASLAQSLS